MPSRISSFSFLLAMSAAPVAAAAFLSWFFTEQNYQSRAVDALNSATAVIALGSSHIATAIRPALYPWPTVPLATNYGDEQTAERVLSTHVAKLPGLKVVLLEFDYTTLFMNTAQENPYGLVQLGVTPSHAVSDFVADFSGTIKRLLWPFYALRMTPHDIDLKLLADKLAKRGRAIEPGYNGSNGTSPWPALEAKVKWEQGLLQDRHIDLEIPRSNRRAAIILTHRLAVRGIATVLLRTPLSPRFRAIGGAQLRKRVDEQLALAHAEGLDPGLPFWDFSLEDSFEESDFRDADHLNDQGAKRLAPLLVVGLQTFLLL